VQQGEVETLSQIKFEIWLIPCYPRPKSQHREENMTDFVKAWSKYLPDNHREALLSALDILSDDFFDSNLEDEEHVFRELLPRKYFHQYTPLFLKKFYVTLMTVGYKLALPQESNTLLSSTAEEIALHILIEEATTLLDMHSIKADFGDFEDYVYQDIDFEFLYESEFDGIEDGETGDELHIVNLRFADWFKPFGDASMPVHPYCWNAV